MGNHYSPSAEKEHKALASVFDSQAHGFDIAASSLLPGTQLFVFLQIESKQISIFQSTNFGISDFTPFFVFFSSSDLGG